MIWRAQKMRKQGGNSRSAPLGHGSGPLLVVVGDGGDGSAFACALDGRGADSAVAMGSDVTVAVGVTASDAFSGEAVSTFFDEHAVSATPDNTRT